MLVNHKDHISIFDNVISKIDCQNIIDTYELKAKIVKEKSSNYKEDQGVFQRRDGSLGTWDLPGINNFIIEKVYECFDIYKEEFFQVQSCNIKFEEVKLQKTPIRGGFHSWHCEIGDITMIERCIVWMIYLNDIPDGEGETEFLWQKLRLQPKAGRLVIWPAFFTHIHRGNPVYTHPKYIATGWGNYLDPDFEKYYFKDEQGFHHKRLDNDMDL